MRRIEPTFPYLRLIALTLQGAVPSYNQAGSSVIVNSLTWPHLTVWRPWR